MDKVSYMRSFHSFLQREISQFSEKVLKEIKELNYWRRQREIDFEMFKREMGVSELRVMIIKEQFKALELHCESFEIEINTYLASFLDNNSNSVNGMWFGSIGERIQCIERIYDYKYQVLESMNEVSKKYAELIIIYDHLISNMESIYKY